MSGKNLSPEQLQAQLAPFQEKRGYYFNPDVQMTRDILEQLLVNKENLGYLACPCRLPNGKYDEDKDVLCPCAYREADVREFGWCFCGLYVSKDWLDGKIPQDAYVPDRRPRAKIKI